jgi:hypothetical protein
MPNYTAESIRAIDLVGHDLAGKASRLRYAVRTFSNNGNDVSLWIGVAAHLTVYGMLRHRY